MPYFTVAEDKFKLSAAKHFFVAPADYNYVHARFCRIAGLHKEFSWQCLQALEKYLKAGLVLNDVPVNGFSHNLPKLLGKHREVYGEFMIGEPVRPADLPAKLWKSKTLDELFDWIHYFGHPNSRYGLRSYVNHPSDLFLLDELVFELRRRIGRLSSVIGSDIYLDDEPRDEVLEECRGSTFSHVIVAHPTFQLFKINSPDVSFAEVGEGLGEALYRWNFRWARNAEDLERPPPRTVSAQFGGFGNSMLFLLQEAIKKPHPTPERTAAIHRRMGWLLDHVPLGRDLAKEMRAQLPPLS